VHRHLELQHLVLAEEVVVLLQDLLLVYQVVLAAEVQITVPAVQEQELLDKEILVEHQVVQIPIVAAGEAAVLAVLVVLEVQLLVVLVV
jgi:hypothetical protein